MAFWDKITSRGNVQDRRGFGSAILGSGGIGLGGIALILVLNYFSGGDLTDILQQLAQQVPAQIQNQSQFEGQDKYEVFASTVLGSTNDFWKTKFTELNKTYTEPRLVLFRNATAGGCGVSSSAVGPHYCPLDNTIYLDETFFEEIRYRLDAVGGDVAESYVIAHEVGHHVQNILGLLESGSLSESNNQASVQQELQADCFAGLWANSIRDLGVFETGEISEAMDIASAIGDDRIQQKTEGQINPETWTHGSSEQRLKAFTTGYESGSLSVCGI